MLAALVAKKADLTVCHIEAGLRSGEFDLPEEINRRIIDSCTDYFFTTDCYATNNILREFGPSVKVFEVGNLLAENLGDRKVVNVKGDSKKILLTFHRRSLKQDRTTIKRLADALYWLHVHHGYTFLHVSHPNAGIVQEVFQGVFVNSGSAGYECVPAMTHSKFIDYLCRAGAVITDSGGLQEECVVLERPCVTFRVATERPVTIDSGWNILVDPFCEDLGERFLSALQSLSSSKKTPIPMWDSKVSERISSELIPLCTS
jgi:UDP-N-acetylglucosamine 2-epimerase (non-hydrolysing)